jgi:hypothetical protein
VAESRGDLDSLRDEIFILSVNAEKIATPKFVLLGTDHTFVRPISRSCMASARKPDLFSGGRPRNMLGSLLHVSHSHTQLERRRE